MEKLNDKIKAIYKVNESNGEKQIVGFEAKGYIFLCKNKESVVDCYKRCHIYLARFGFDFYKAYISDNVEPVEITDYMFNKMGTEPLLDMITNKFVGDCKFFAKGPDFYFNGRYVNDNQHCFESFRDTVIDSIFTNSESSNKKIKERLFEIKSDYLPYGNLGKETDSLYENFKTSSEYSKAAIVNQLKKIHQSQENDVKMYLNIAQKWFIQNLTKEEKDFVNVETQEEYEKYLEDTSFRTGYATCYSEDLLQLYPYDITRTVTFADVGFKGFMRRRMPGYDFVPYSAIMTSNQYKRKIYEALKLHGLIKNEEEDFLYKQKLDEYAINEENYPTVFTNFVFGSEARGRK